MAPVTVYAPNPDHNGITAGVQFRRGVAEVDESDRAALACFRRHGYSIGEPVEREAADGDGVEEPVGVEDTSAGSLAMPPKVGKGSGADAWSAFAAEIGVDVEGKGRAEIIAAVEAHLNGGAEASDTGETEVNTDDDEVAAEDAEDAENGADESEEGAEVDGSDAADSDAEEGSEGAEEGSDSEVEDGE